MTDLLPDLDHAHFLRRAFAVAEQARQGVTILLAAFSLMRRGGWCWNRAMATPPKAVT